jgi:hypothetical protein
MTSALTVREKDELTNTIDDFVSAHDPDKKIMFLGAFVDYIENRQSSKNSSLYVTACILYARILDRLDKDNDKSARSMINLAISEYMERAGIDMEKYR